MFILQMRMLLILLAKMVHTVGVNSNFSPWSYGGGEGPGQRVCFWAALLLLQDYYVQKENAQEINCRLFKFKASLRPENHLFVYLTLKASGSSMLDGPELVGPECC